MISKQHQLQNNAWSVKGPVAETNGRSCQLVLVFGAPELIVQPAVFEYLKGLYAEADIVLASTAGEIVNDQVYDNTVVATAVFFEKTTVKCASVRLNESHNSLDTGSILMSELNRDDLNCVFVISDGTKINGSELVAGFNSKNIKNVPVTGGLAGDGDHFQKTFTGLNAVPSEGNVIAIGLYGNDLVVSHGSMGGWDEFGHERTITRSDKNVLFEIDGKNALSLYKEYLGEYSNELPGSALLFPLSLKRTEGEKAVVRTILAIDEATSSMTFAGNVPEGSKVRLMKANFDRLVLGSTNAAQSTKNGMNQHQAQLAILISCVGRKLILQNRVEEEVEAAREVFGDDVVMTGFYSYGEISPFSAGVSCELHNQTMTITTFAEL